MHVQESCEFVQRYLVQALLSAVPDQTNEVSLTDSISSKAGTQVSHLAPSIITKAICTTHTLDLQTCNTIIVWQGSQSAALFQHGGTFSCNVLRLCAQNPDALVGELGATEVVLQCRGDFETEAE